MINVPNYVGYIQIQCSKNHSSWNSRTANIMLEALKKSDEVDVLVIEKGLYTEHGQTKILTKKMNDADPAKPLIVIEIDHEAEISA